MQFTFPVETHFGGKFTVELDGFEMRAKMGYGACQVRSRRLPLSLFHVSISHTGSKHCPFEFDFEESLTPTRMDSMHAK